MLASFGLHDWWTSVEFLELNPGLPKFVFRAHVQEDVVNLPKLRERSFTVSDVGQPSGELPTETSGVGDHRDCLECLCGAAQKAAKYGQAGLRVSSSLFDSPYLSEDDAHQGLILHSIYHRPNGWDHIPAGSKIPYGESSMWGDYHARELALYLQRMIDGKPELTFFSGVSSSGGSVSGGRT